MSTVYTRPRSPSPRPVRTRTIPPHRRDPRHGAPRSLCPLPHQVAVGLRRVAVRLPEPGHRNPPLAPPTRCTEARAPWTTSRRSGPTAVTCRRPVSSGTTWRWSPDATVARPSRPSSRRAIARSADRRPTRGCGSGAARPAVTADVQPGAGSPADGRPRPDRFGRRFPGESAQPGELIAHHLSLDPAQGRRVRRRTGRSSPHRPDPRSDTAARSALGGLEHFDGIGVPVRPALGGHPHPHHSPAARRARTPPDPRGGPRNFPRWPPDRWTAPALRARSRSIREAATDGAGRALILDLLHPRGGIELPGNGRHHDVGDEQQPGLET